MKKLANRIWEPFSGEVLVRLRRQITFVLELDRLKQVFRQTPLLDSSRKENAAEHSWHLTLMAIILAEYAVDKIDILRVLKMVLIHDVVEIDAGDTFCYDPKGNVDKDEREQRAADRLFGLLPADQRVELRSLWEEFEQCVSTDARFAAALDRIQPLLHNYVADGGTWREHSVASVSVRERNAQVGASSPVLGEFVNSVIDAAVVEGILKER